jgi:hypothetical protein
MDSADTATVSTAVGDMGRKVRRQRPVSESQSLSSASFRLHRMYGESVGTWEHRLSGLTSAYRRVAQMNGVLRMMGMVDKLTELMMPVELSLGPAGVLPLPEALHQAELADCREQEGDETFRHRLTTGSATVADAREYLRLSGVQCARAEIARRETQRWIEEQEGER